MDSANDTKTSYWGSHVFEFTFTGTSLSIELKTPQNQRSLVAFIDNATVVFDVVNGVGNLTATPLSEGTHAVRIITPGNHAGPNASRNEPFVLKGLWVDKGATVLKTDNRKPTMEIVGDSISDGWYGMTALGYAGELLLGYNTVNVAFAGITLSDNAPSAPAFPPYSNGMETMYFKQTNDPTNQNAPNWDFAIYQPEAIMINIGTNDFGRGVKSEDFEKTYVDFLQKLRRKNPNAVIYAVSPFGGMLDGETFIHFMEEPISKAVAQVNAAGDRKVVYIDTSGWLTQENVKTYIANESPYFLHPSVTGISYLGGKVAAAVQAANKELEKIPENPESNPESKPESKPESNLESKQESKPESAPGETSDGILSSTPVATPEDGSVASSGEVQDPSSAVSSSEHSGSEPNPVPAMIGAFVLGSAVASAAAAGAIVVKKKKGKKNQNK